MVYLVEDSQPIRERLCEVLSLVPEVRVVGEAETAAEAIAGIRDTAPDVAIVDLHLREGSALDVLRTLATDARRPTFVVLTNLPTEQHRKACLAAGASHFLDKSRDFLRINEIVSARGPARG
jgi:DNA-binding NarL/FixJ family response regulator